MTTYLAGVGADELPPQAQPRLSDRTVRQQTRANPVQRVQAVQRPVEGDVELVGSQLHAFFGDPPQTL
jgi:hypothetical protein